MSLHTTLGTNVQIIDLITPFLNNDSILKINRACKRWIPKRNIVVNRKYGNLEVLDLSCKNLTMISKEIRQLQNLTHLYLYRNKLTSIPSDIGEMINLKVLDLDNNQLTSIPKEIGQLQNLQQLYLCDNKLTSILSEIGEIINLQELRLDYNMLVSIPNEIGQLYNLKRLDLEQ